MMAGRAVGHWNLNGKEIPLNCEEFKSIISEDERDMRHSKWKMAIERSLGWHT